MAIAAKFQTLLDSCQEMEFSHLRPLIDRMFENADVALLDFAEKAESNVAQAVFFEAMNEFRKKRKSIEQHFYTELKSGFSGFPSRPDQNEQESGQGTELGKLSLVATDEVETYVASQNAASKLASRIMDRIFALKQRLAVLNSGNAIEENQIPGGPAWLTASFQHAVGQLELENKVRLVFIALFEKYVLNQADALFNEYNKRLIDADILPHLRYEVRKQDGSVEIVERHVSGDEIDDQADTDTDIFDPANEATPSQLGDELFGRICELMSGRGNTRQATSRSPGNVSPIRGSHQDNANFHGSHQQSPNFQGGNQDNANYGNAGTPISGKTLASQISNLQYDLQSSAAGSSSAEFIENIEIDENLIQVLQGTLANEREKIFGAIDRRQLPAADANVIELVGMMFEYMLQEDDLPNLVKALLSRLHTPMLKVAVIDKTFFTHAGHSARKLLNDMTRAGKRWVDESAIDRGIFPRMRVSVDRIMSDFQENVELFDDVLEEFSKSVAELDKRAEHVEKRTTEAANGQEKLQAARSRAQNEVRILIQDKPVVEAVREFLQRIWADKLTFLLLRNEQGDESSIWNQSIALAERIVEFSMAPEDDEQRENRRQKLDGLQQEIREATQTLQKPDKEKLLKALFESQSLALDAEQAAVVVVAAPEPETEETPEPAASPEQLAMLEKLNSIPFGTWFEFRKPGSPSSRAKLSWRSTVTEKFMFVDQMGVKAAVISKHDLANCMIDGRVRILQPEKKPFVDRALNAIHRMLDHAA